MGEYDVRTDRSKNRLYLTLDGYLDEDETAAAADETIEAAESLDAGFTMVNDISNFQPASEGATANIERGKRGVAKRDVDAVVRVVESTIGKLQFDRVGKDVVTYDVATAESVAEADRVLDERL